MPPQKPLVAAVEGFALAGGLELALACDLIIAGDTAMFGLPEVRLGLIAGSGGLIRLPDRIPRSLATKYALTGERFGAKEAERHGMIVETCAAGDALNRALVLAQEIAANAPLSVQMTKRILNEFSSDRESEVWQRQAPLIEEVLSSADATEGALAFTEKRNPMWSGT
jgi:enoyl-CoA hydratase